MQQEQAQTIWKMIRSIKFAMLTTEDDGQLRSRPMAASQDSFDGTLWFFTRASAHKVEEVKSDQQVGVSYADPDSQNYVSMSGTAALVRDQAAIDSHWTESLRTWFPNGKTDPDVALLRIDVTQAEYWDAPNSKMLHAYGYLKARLTGEPPAGGENEKVTVR